MWHEQFKRRYAINLPTRPDRRAHAQSELTRMGMSFEFFDTVRGQDNPFAAWFFNSILKQTAPVTPGALGCHTHSPTNVRSASVLIASRR